MTPKRLTSITHRYGVTSVLAMLFLVLFAVLALGFMALVSTSVQISQNDADGARSMLAAESAMQFARYHLATADMGSSTDPDEMFTKLCASLDAKLSGTANMGGYDPVDGAASDGSLTLEIPGAGWIDFGAETGQGRITMRKAGNSVEVTATGRQGADRPSRKGIQYDFDPYRAAWVSPGQGVLTRSPVELTNGAKVTGGDVTCASTNGNLPALNMSGGARISQVSGNGGNFYWVDGAGQPQIKNGSKIDGVAAKLSKAPNFPLVDGSVFEQFVPSKTALPNWSKVINKDNVYSIPSTAKLTNVRIKANPSGSTIYFSNSMDFNGVIWIESPNKVNFGGGCRINGIVVTDNNTSIPAAQCEITLANGVRMYGVETLSSADFTIEQWATEKLALLKTLSGTLVLAPNYKLILAGGARTFAGQLLADSFHLSNGYKGTIAGNLIGMSPSSKFTMEGGTEVTFTTGNSSGAGLYSGGHYRIDPASYAEVEPEE